VSTSNPALPALPSPDDVAGLLRRELAADAGRPLVTFYDDATGERVELSVATFDNWVAKTANLLVDGLAAEPGARVGLLLPLHWQAAVWHLAAWCAGLVVDLGDPLGAEVVVTGPDDLPRVAAGSAADVVALSLRPFGAPFADPLPAGILDYGREVAAYGDRFQPAVAPAPAAPALVAGDLALSQGEIAGIDLGELARGDRVLTAADYTTWPALRGGLVRPLVAGASLVLCRNLDAGRLVSRATAERVTVVTGILRPAAWPAPVPGPPPRFVPLSS
jgi:uncharacterized protein (TIGR03089 family)